MMIFATLASAAAYPKLWKEGRRRDVVASAVVLSAGVILAIYRLIGHPVKSPLFLLTNLFRPVSKLLTQIMTS